MKILRLASVIPRENWKNFSFGGTVCMCVSFVGKFKILFLDTCTCQFDVRVGLFWHTKL